MKETQHKTWLGEKKKEKSDILADWLKLLLQFEQQNGTFLKKQFYSVLLIQ